MAKKTLPGDTEKVKPGNVDLLSGGIPQKILLTLRSLLILGFSFDLLIQNCDKHGKAKQLI